MDYKKFKKELKKYNKLVELCREKNVCLQDYRDDTLAVLNLLNLPHEQRISPFFTSIKQATAWIEDYRPITD